MNESWAPMETIRYHNYWAQRLSLRPFRNWYWLRKKRPEGFVEHVVEDGMPYSCYVHGSTPFVVTGEDVTRYDKFYRFRHQHKMFYAKHMDVLAKRGWNAKARFRQ